MVPAEEGTKRRRGKEPQATTAAQTGDQGGLAWDGGGGGEGVLKGGRMPDKHRVDAWPRSPSGKRTSKAQ